MQLGHSARFLAIAVSHSGNDLAMFPAERVAPHVAEAGRLPQSAK